MGKLQPEYTLYGPKYVDTLTSATTNCRFEKPDKRLEAVHTVYGAILMEK